MFSKLAFKNVGRSMKDYGVWFLTIAFGVCLFYVFNSLETQAVFQYLGKAGPLQGPTAQAIRELIGMLSVFVWVVLAFLILYASGFLIRRRKGELGTYLLLGMERGQVARLLLLETLCMGVLALLAGLGLGVLAAWGLSAHRRASSPSATGVHFLRLPGGHGENGPGLLPYLPAGNALPPPLPSPGAGSWT